MIQLNRNKIKLFNLIYVTTLGCIWFLSLFYIPDVDIEFRSCVILPLLFISGYVFFLFVRKNSILDIHLIIIFLFFIKIFVLPELVIFCGTFDTSKMNASLANYIGDSIILQGLEWFATIFGLCFIKTGNLEVSFFERKFDSTVNKRVWRTIFLCFLIIVIALVVYPSLLYKFRPIFFSSETQEIFWKQNSTIAVSTISGAIYYPLNWLITVTRFTFVYLLIVFIWNKRKKKSQAISIIISCLVIISFLIAIVPDDVAASTIAAFCLLVILTKLYPEKRRLITNALLIVAILFFGYIFFGKAFSTDTNLNESLLHLMRRLNAYFSGFVNVAASMGMECENKFSYFMGDFLRSFPVIKGFFTHMSTTTELFNSALGYDIIYNSQIIPLEGQAYFYFNYAGTLIMPIVVIKICMSFYKKMLRSNGTYDYFIHCFYSLLLAFGLVMYDSFLIFYLVLSYLPLLIINILANRRRIKFERVNIS